jgi:hypothetical protein
MNAASRTAVCVALLVSTAALADTFYRYHDAKTGRDVYVDRLEQVPPKLRGQAQIVFESGALGNHDETRRQAPSVPPDDSLPEKLIKDVAPQASQSAADIGRASSGKSLLKDGAAIAAATIDARLGRAGAKPLVEEERSHLAGFVFKAIVLASIATLCAFIVWIVLIVCALRDKHYGWGVAVFLFWPLGYLYLLLHFAKGRRLLKALATLAYLSPSLVALWAAWHLYSWFQVVMRARGRM